MKTKAPTSILLFALALGCAAAEVREEMVRLPINGCEMAILLRYGDASNPVLLYLHGGPGDSQVPFAKYATKDLAAECTVAYWDQRGTGLSYSPSIPRETMTIGQFLLDTREVTRYLQERFGQEKILLLGHSWGSVLGLLAAQKYPGDYLAYIGVGQAISWATMIQGRIAWLEKRLDLADGSNREKLESMKRGESTGSELIRDNGGSLHSLSQYELGRIAERSKYAASYSYDLYKKGEKLSAPIFDEATTIDFDRLPAQYELPIYFFIGKYDYVTPAEPVIAYCDSIRTKSKALVLFEESGHRMDVEEPDKFQREILRILARHSPDRP